MNSVGRISYLNALPFFHEWDEKSFPLVSGTPRFLAVQTALGQLAAGPLPIVACWDLEKDFEPLLPWGIGVSGESRSVFVLSKKPFSTLDGLQLGVTQDSKASVALCRVLTEEKYGHRVKFKRGFHDEDTARLIIGDEGVQAWLAPPDENWPYRTDLAKEWHDWKGLPFVFARWVVKRTLPQDQRDLLSQQIEASFRASMEALPAIAREEAKRLLIPAASIKDYLDGFVYRLGEREIQSLELFRALYEKKVAVKG